VTPALETDMPTHPTHRIRLSRALAWCASAGGALLLSGCMATNGYGGYPPSGQYPQQPYPGASASQLVGTVQGMDPGGRILLDAQHSRYGGAYGGGSRVEVLFDQRTPLHYQGRAYPVSGLEPGDVIRVDTAQSGGRLWARSIELLRDVRSTGGQYGAPGGQYGQPGGQYGNVLGGSITHVDPRARVIGFTQGGYSGAATQVRYDERTVVEYRGGTYRPENLERGDVVRIQARQWGNGWLAERILVETSVRERY
jgi:hypothetical protein